MDNGVKAQSVLKMGGNGDGGGGGTANFAV